MNNIQLRPNQQIEVKSTTPFAYNAICEAIYMASKNRIEIDLWIGDFLIGIDSNSTADTLNKEYKNYLKNKE